MAQLQIACICSEQKQPHGLYVITLASKISERCTGSGDIEGKVDDQHCSSWVLNRAREGAETMKDQDEGAQTTEAVSRLCRRKDG